MAKLTTPMKRLLRKGSYEWGPLPKSVGRENATVGRENATLNALERRNLVMVRMVPRRWPIELEWRCITPDERAGHPHMMRDKDDDN
jgi:hypothetical protein